MPAQLIVVAKHSYQKSGDNILNFKRGDLMEVLEETNGKWWAARMVKDENLAGYIPSSYVQEAHRDLLTEQAAASTAQSSISTSASGSFRQRFLIFETSSAPSYSPQPPRNDWSRSTLPAKATFNSPLSSPPKSATIARDNPGVIIEMADSGEEERSRSPSPLPADNSSSGRMTTINPMGALTKELRFEQKRGVQLGRPELQKVFDGGRSSGGHVSPNVRPGAKKEPPVDKSSELGKMLQKQTQRLEDHEREETEEAAKPEFMRFKLKKADESTH